MFGKLHKKIGLLTHPHTTPPYLGPSRKKNIFWRLPKSPKVFFPNCARYEEKKIITTVRPGPGCTRMHTGKPLQAADLHWGRVRLPHQMNFWKNSKRPSTTPPPHFWKIILQFFYDRYGCIYARRYDTYPESWNYYFVSTTWSKSPVSSSQNLQFEFLDWKWHFSENSLIW